MSDALLVPDEVCARLRITRRHLYRLVARGVLPHLKVSNRLRFEPEALDQWIADAGETATGYSREIYLDCPPGDQSDWVTELQFVLAICHLRLPPSRTSLGCGKHIVYGCVFCNFPSRRLPADTGHQ